MTSVPEDAAVERSGRFFHLFVYDEAPGAPGSTDLPAGCERVATADVAGTLYGAADKNEALVLAGTGRIGGEVWRCPVEILTELDSDERVLSGLFRRVGVQVDEYPCWVYVAGPELARRLTLGRQSSRGEADQVD
jgi:hypothetical protein